MKCVNGTFETSSSAGPSFSKDENTVLKAEATQWKAYGSAYWPSAVINERTYRGDLVPDSVMGALCSAYVEEPGFCN